jgi:hypothetical protein
LNPYPEFLYPTLSEDLKAPVRRPTLQTGDSIPQALIETRFMLEDCAVRHEKIVQACSTP